MNITCDREKLLHAFQTAATVAPSRSPKPILQNVKIIAEEQTTLIATDMEIGIRIDVDGIDITAPGTAVLPVARFGSLLRESSDEQLQIEADDQGITVKGARSRFNLPAENPAEFPNVAEFDSDKFHEAPARLVKELIRRTLFATDPDSNRYALGGILLEMDEEQIVAVGTDGRRLAKMAGPAQSINGHVTGDQTVIAPTRSMQLIERALSDADAEIKIASRANDLLVKTPRATIFSRLVEGRFPKWRDVLPERKGAVNLELTVGPVYAGVRQAAIVASDDSRGVDLHFADGTLVLSARTAEVGQSRVELPIAYDGEPVTLTLDHRYVADFLKVLDAEKTFTLDVENADSAAVFSTADGYGYVVMPLASRGG